MFPAFKNAYFSIQIHPPTILIFFSQAPLYIFTPVLRKRVNFIIYNPDQMRQFDRDRTMMTSHNQSALINQTHTYIQSMYHHYFQKFWQNKSQNYLKQLHASRPFEINGMTTYSEIRNNNSKSMNDSYSELQNLIRQQSKSPPKYEEQPTISNGPKVTNKNEKQSKLEIRAELAGKSMSSQEGREVNKPIEMKNEIKVDMSKKAQVEKVEIAKETQKQLEKSIDQKQQKEPQQKQESKESSEEGLSSNVIQTEQKVNKKVEAQPLEEKDEIQAAEEPSIIEDIPSKEPANPIAQDKAAEQPEEKEKQTLSPKKQSESEQEEVQENMPSYYDLLNKQEQEYEEEEANISTSKTQHEQPQPQIVHEAEVHKQFQEESVREEDGEIKSKAQVPVQPEETKVEQQNNTVEQQDKPVEKTSQVKYLPQQKQEFYSPESSQIVVTESLPPATAQQVSSKDEHKPPTKESFHQRIDSYTQELYTFIDSQDLCSNCLQTKCNLAKTTQQKEQLNQQVEHLSKEKQELQSQNEEQRQKIKHLTEVLDKLKKEHFNTGIELQKMQKKVKEYQEKGEDFYSGRKSNGKYQIKRQFSQPGIKVNDSTDDKVNASAPLINKFDNVEDEYESIKNSSDEESVNQVPQNGVKGNSSEDSN